MKSLYITTIVFLLSFKTIQAQHFVGDITFVGNEASFSIRPQGGDIVGSISIFSFFIRWSKSQGNNFLFGPLVNNNTNFPGIDIETSNNSVSDPLYNNQLFSFIGLTTPRTYLNGVSYEVLRTTLGGNIPSSFDLVADNSVAVPYYFNIQGGEDTVNYTTFVVSPFTNPTGSSGTFFFKTFSLAPLPITLKSFTGKALDCKALLTWTTSSETNGKHFEIESSNDGINFTTAAIVTAVGNTSGDQAYSKLLPLTSAANFYRLKSVSLDDKARYSNVVLLRGKDCVDLLFAVQIIANPVANHQLTMLVKTPLQDDLDIKVISMTGSLVAQFRQKVSKGTSLVKFDLPQHARGQYLVRIQGANNGIITQKIVIE